MTQLLFVHGVATRGGDAYEQSVANRDALFSRILFAGQNIRIHTPLWGDLVPSISKDIYDTAKGAGVFGGLGSGQSLGGLGGGLGLGNAAQPGTGSLATLARAQPSAALDALFVELLETCDANNKPIGEEELNAFARASRAIGADITVGESQLSPDGTYALIGKPASDAALREAIGQAGDAPASYGIKSAIGDAIKHVSDRIRKISSQVVFDPALDLARPWIGFFLGDVFAYLHDSELRKAIQQRVRDKLLAAHGARTPGEKLVVIGHSLGGVILTDMLCSPEQSGLPADLHVDAFFTVGSQPGLFQALGLLRPLASSPLPKPATVGAWFNVFDPIDPLAFRSDPVFAGVKDLRFDSITGVASAHTTYFKRPQFYARARHRLLEHQIIQ